MKAIEELLRHTSIIEKKLGYSFRDRSTLVLAFIHRSFINENRDVRDHNERLEFLGDSILGFLISDFLYKTFPQTPEGDLSSLRSRLVEASSCVVYIQMLDLEQYVLLGKGERMNDGRGRESILADLFEALIGAIYLDGGIEAAKKFLFGHFAKIIDDILKKPIGNWKALLQDFCQRQHQQTPQYRVEEEKGPDHIKTFKISVLINEKIVGLGEGASKKEAQQAAARDALKKLGVEA